MGWERRKCTIILLTEAEEEEQRLREELAVVELKVGTVLAKLSDEKLYDFMVNRFLDFMTIEAAANDVGLSYSWGRLAVERGVAEVQEILDGMEADGEFDVDSDLGDGSALCF